MPYMRFLYQHQFQDTRIEGVHCIFVQKYVSFLPNWAAIFQQT